MYNPTVPSMQPPQWPGGQANQFISPNYQQAQNAYLIQQLRGNGCCNANLG